MLPLGASLVALPVGILTLLLENYVPAIIILAGGPLSVANVDNLVRPRLVCTDATMSFAAAMVSALVHDGVSRPMDRRSRYQRDKPRQSDCSKGTRSRPADGRTYEPWAHFRHAVLARVYALFGIFDVIYRPVIMILFLTTVDVYQEVYQEHDLATDQTPLVDSTARAPTETAQSSSPPIENPSS